MKLLVGISTIALISAMGSHSCRAQSEESTSEVVPLHTLMEHYAPEFVIPPEERVRLKMERRRAVRYREAVIDTLPISRRKKRKLRRELYRTPFTDTFKEVLSSLQPEQTKKELPD